MIGLVVVGVAVVLVALRGDRFGIDAFVLFGAEYTSEVPPGLGRVYEGDGYDGQQFYMLALDPTGQQMDEIHDRVYRSPASVAYRHQRIGYPLLVRVMSLGIPALLPYAMVSVNVIALGTVGWAGARLAAAAGRNPSWGLLLVAWPGFLISLSRGTAEIVAAAGVVTGLAMMREGRDWISVAAFSVAVLSRETTVIFAVGALVVSVADAGTRRGIRHAIPLAVFGMWQAILFGVWGVTPALSGSGHVQPLLQGIVESSPNWHTYEWLLALTVAGVGAIGAATAVRSRRLSVPAVALPIYILLLLSLSSAVWIEPYAFLRVATGMAVASIVIALGRSTSSRVLAVGLVPSVVATASLVTRAL